MTNAELIQSLKAREVGYYEKLGYQAERYATAEREPGVLITEAEQASLLTLLDHEAALREMVEKLIAVIEDEHYGTDDGIQTADTLRQARALLAAAETER